MSDETPAEQTPDAPAPLPPSAPVTPPSALPASPGDAVTEGGYAYTVVDETPRSRERGAKKPKIKRESKPLSIAAPLLAALIILPAVVAAAAAWFVSGMFGDEGGGDARTSANVASVINVFSQSQGGTLRRLEGELPAGLPDDLPAYPGARVIASLVQVTDEDALYLVVYDTGDGVEDVASYFDEAFGTDPWQIDLGQDGDGSVRQFSKIDDADIEGLVLLTESKDGDLTTILASVQVISGAADAELEEFTPPISRPLPEGFPDGIPPYPDAIVTATIFQHASQGDTFGLTLITRDSAESALEFFRDDFQGKGWTVNDSDGSGSGIADAIAITFESDDATISGNIAAGEFGEDRNYTQIEVQVRKLDDGG